MTDLIEHNQYTPVGLELPIGMDFDEWIHRGKMLLMVRKAINWYLGDWLNFGEREYGEKYAQAVEVTGYDIDTLRKFQWVSAQIPPERRREKLEFGHHDAVAALPPAEADKILVEAETNEWSVAETRQRARPQRGQREDDAKAMDCPFCGADLEEWLQKR